MKWVLMFVCSALLVPPFGEVFISSDGDVLGGMRGRLELGLIGSEGGMTLSRLDLGLSLRPAVA